VSDPVADLLAKQQNGRDEQDRLRKVMLESPPGTVGVIGGDLGRFAAFNISMWGVIAHLPMGSNARYARGVDVSGNCNSIIRDFVGEWVWMMGDDHYFAPDILLRLLEHDVDVVVPHCLKRTPPWPAVVYSHQDEDGWYHTAKLPKEGLTEIYAAGSAGMLIRRRVLEALEDPWFRPAPDAEGLNEDLYFCQKVREAGFKIYCDPAIPLGHIATYNIFPKWHNDEVGWNVLWEFAEGVTFQPPVRAVAPEEALSR
jgi:hypothetical protein